jgi:hypothetical protein
MMVEIRFENKFVNETIEWCKRDEISERLHFFLR